MWFGSSGTHRGPHDRRAVGPAGALDARRRAVEVGVVRAEQRRAVVGADAERGAGTARERRRIVTELVRAEVARGVTARRAVWVERHVQPAVERLPNLAKPSSGARCLERP